MSPVNLPLAYTDSNYTLVIRPTIQGDNPVTGGSFGDPAQTASTFLCAVTSTQYKVAWVAIGY